jgi:hypothetical protein
MQNTTNYNLKKPEYTDFADIADINDNMDTIDAQLAAPTGDSADSTTTFTTSDTADGGASSWTNVPALTSGETHKSLFAKMSQMFKNIRYLYKMLGTTDISSIGNGTVTNALSVLNANRHDEVAAGAYVTIVRKQCFTAAGMCFLSAAITLTDNLTSSNNLLIQLPTAAATTDGILFRAGYPYPIFVSSNVIKPNGSIPTGSYFLMILYKTA